MSSIQNFLMISTFVFMIACASQMPGRDAIEIAAPANHEKEIELAVDTISALSSDHYQAYQVSVKNNTDRWLRFDQINMEFPELGTAPEVLLGSDLQSYSKSVDRRNQVSAYNTQLVLGSIAAVGVVGIATSGGDATGLRSGAALLGGSYTYAVIDELLNSKNKAEFQGTLPDNHLLKPFDVAPEMVVSRWIIVKVPKAAPMDRARVMLTEKGQNKRTFEVEWLTNKVRPVEKKVTNH